MRLRKLMLKPEHNIRRLWIRDWRILIPIDEE
jgi:hypothetical protein